MTSSIVISLRKRLPDKSNTAELEQIAKRSRVSFHTLLKIVNGATSNPRINTVERLLRYLDNQTA